MSQRHYIQNECLMLVTTVTANRLPLFRESANALEAVECLYRVQGLRPFFLYAFVVMPDHIHLLVEVPPPATISRIMNSYKSSIASGLGFRKIWQPRFHIREVNNRQAAVDYIHCNPCKKGLCLMPEEYLWSSASGKWDVSDLPF